MQKSVHRPGGAFVLVRWGVVRQGCRLLMVLLMAGGELIVPAASPSERIPAIGRHAFDRVSRGHGRDEVDWSEPRRRYLVNVEPRIWPVSVSSVHCHDMVEARSVPSRLMAW